MNVESEETEPRFTTLLRMRRMTETSEISVERYIRPQYQFCGDMIL